MTSRAIAYLLERGYKITPLVLKLYPELAKYYVKTQAFFLRTMRRLIQTAYDGDIGGEFITVAANLISGQLRRAYQEAWTDEGFGGDLPQYLTRSWADMVAGQQNHLLNLYLDIQTARMEGLPVNQLLARAELWATRYSEAYNTALALIEKANGGKLEWVFGDAKHCNICSGLNGIVAYASIWDELRVKPQGAPNPALAKERGGCGGWRCKCRLKPTKKRQTRNARIRIQKAAYG